MHKPVLVVDDEPEMRLALREALVRMGYTCTSASNPEEALSMKSLEDFSLVITDMKMPKMDGLTFIKNLRTRTPGMPVIVITGYGTVENAVTAMKEGAVDYLMKPFSYTTLKKVILKVASPKSDPGMIYSSSVMKDLVARVLRAAGSEITVLISGESGTGKELLARFLHAASPRKKGPFIAVNCAAIPDNLLESELFGHERGAFTGAVERRTGRFEMANGGSILLDEISEMPMSLQVKLLRVIQEREVDRVGGDTSVPVDIRILATTNRNLQREVEEGRFREDLFYRLNVLPLELPPLRERPEDIELLAWSFVAKYSGGRELKLSRAALGKLREQIWKGNIRELENVIQRACLLSDGEIRPDHFGLQPKKAQAVNNVTVGSVKDIEKQLIMKTLDETGGNKSRAAKTLGISVRTLRNKLKQYGQGLPEGEKFSCQAADKIA